MKNKNVYTNTAIENYIKESDYLSRLTMNELNEKYTDCPVAVHEYEINDKKYVVHSHFVGEKDIDTVIRNIAFTRAMTETLTEKAA